MNAPVGKPSPEWLVVETTLDPFLHWVAQGTPPTWGPNGYGNTQRSGCGLLRCNVDDEADWDKPRCPGCLKADKRTR